MNVQVVRTWLGICLVSCCGIAGAATESLAAGTGSASPQRYVPQFLAEPPTATAEQLQRQAQFASRQRGAGSIGAARVGFAPPDASTQSRMVGSSVAGTDAAGVEPMVPATLKAFTNRVLVPKNGGGSSDVNEPSHANEGKYVWYTGNWYAGRSACNGCSFVYVNPYADFPDFCCDQDVIHDTGRDLMIWYRQGVQLGGGDNNFKIGVSQDGGGSWNQYTINYTNYGGLPLGWFDYPQVAITKNYLWITSNYFNTNGTFQRMILTKISLDQLQAGGGISWNYWSRTTGWSWAPIQGAKDVMYIGDHTNQSTFNVCTQPEINTNFSCFDIAIPAWTATGRGSAVCTAPNGLNPCARLDQRVNVGWLKEDETTNRHVVGFFWTVAQGNGFSYPYVNAVTLDAQTLAVLGRPYIYSQGFAFAYAGASPNARGALGIATYIIGGGYYPYLVAGVDDDYNGQPPGWELVGIAISDNVVGNRWGDYLRVRAHNPVGNVWGVSGAITHGTVQEPHYSNFGRERDEASFYRFRGR